jgi:hypothetical protein
MEDLVAKNVFGELTLGDVWGQVSDISEIELEISGRRFLFRLWDELGGSLNLYFDYQGNDPDPEMSFNLGSRARIVGDDVLVEWRDSIESRLTFFRRIPMDLSRFLPSSKKPG